MTGGPAAPRLAWEEAGQGIPVVLLHGFPFCREVFSAIAPALAQVGRVLAVDLPGFGQSPPLPTGFTLADVAREVLDLVDGLGLTPVVLVGHSMGGYVALEIAAQRPELLAGLVLLASHPRADTPEAKARRYEGIQAIGQGRRQAFLEGFLDRLWSPWAKERAPRLVGEVRGMAEAVPDQVLEGYLRAMAERPDHTATWQTLAVPTAVLVGEADPLIPKEMAAAVAAEASRAQLLVVPEAGHLPMVERPVVTAEMLARFVRGTGR